MLGSIISNNVVKVVSRQKEPARNSLADGAGAILHVH
jgi:hypothetical protein